MQPHYHTASLITRSVSMDPKDSVIMRLTCTTHARQTPVLEVIKLFSSSVQLSMKFRLHINAEIVIVNVEWAQKIVPWEFHDDL